MFLMFARTKKIRSQTSTPANHLIELGFRADRFEKHQVHTIGRINTCIHHIYRDGNHRHFLWITEVLNQILCIFYLIMNDLREFSGISRIDLVKRLTDKLDRKSTRLNSSHVAISYAVFCLKQKTNK